MKLQYLGDSKDSFKWDYHDFLVSHLGYPTLKLALMMTPDDHGSDGQSHPSLFPARKEIIEFCHDLRRSRSIKAIKDLPKKSGAAYEVLFHKNGVQLNSANREEYFSAVDSLDDQLIFLDPDNGFEPEKSCSEKHVAYRDISLILDQVSNNSVVSVFQHFRRIPFPKDYAGIRGRLESSYSTAIYWHSLMFVVVSKSETAIQRVVSANENYAKTNPVIPIS